MVHAYSRSRHHRPASLAAAVALSGTMIVGIVLSGPVVEMIERGGPIETYWVADDPPPPDPVKTLPEAPAPAARAVFVPEVIVPLPRPMPGPDVTVDRVPGPPPLPLPPGPGGTGTAPTADPAPPAPVVTRAEIDPRFARDFQPDYPSEMIRREREARLVVRVLVGADGRVKAFEPVNRADPAFVEATRRHALSRWRFRPATRDGIAIEQWREMAVRFELNR